MSRPALLISPLLHSEIASVSEIYQSSSNAVAADALAPSLVDRLSTAFDSSKKDDQKGVLVARRGGLIGVGGKEVEGFVGKGRVEGFVLYSSAQKKDKAGTVKGRSCASSTCPPRIRRFSEGKLIFAPSNSYRPALCHSASSGHRG
jgi:hypothetical protein